MIRILHLDDELAMPLALSRALKQHVPGASELVAVRGEGELRDALQKHGDAFDCLVVDLSFETRPTLSHGEPRTGIEVISDLRQEGYSKPVVMLSASDDPSHMSLAIQAGATEYLSKADPHLKICTALMRCALRDQSQPPRDSRLPLPVGVVGETMRALVGRFERVIASALSPILVRGESGTGKEVVADLLESLVTRKDGRATVPFVRVNCATLQGDVLESELFGHEKGAFTGADRNRPGLFETANGGFIFLDEVAKLSARAQASLLRVLESGEIRPLGSSRSKNLDVRVMAATNENLEDLCERGEFRADLLARLKGYVVELPPFRERSIQEREHILDHLLGRLASKGKSYELAAAVRSILIKAPFCQSNVRELWQVLQAATVEAEEGLIGVSCLPRYFLEGLATLGASQVHTPLGGALAPSPCDSPSLPNGPSVLTDGFLKGLPYAELEQRFFEHVLRANGLIKADGSPESARKIAEHLGLGRHVVAKKLEGLGGNKS